MINVSYYFCNSVTCNLGASPISFNKYKLINIFVISLLELQNMLYHKSALLEASNAHIADLQMKLNNKNAFMQNGKCEIEMVKQQFNKKLSEVKEECRILKEIQCRNKEYKEEEESRKKFLEELPKFSSDLVMVDSNTSVSDQDANFRLSMMLADIDDNCDNIPVIPTTPK